MRTVINSSCSQWKSVVKRVALYLRISTTEQCPRDPFTPALVDRATGGDPDPHAKGTLRAPDKHAFLTPIPTKTWDRVWDGVQA
jgi:hypothetical protein